MDTKVIVVTNQKGGAGKTMLSMQLAGSFAKRGASVFVADADGQSTATRWASYAPDEKPFPAVISGMAAAGKKVHRELQKVVGKYDFIIVDCPPSVDSPVPDSALMVADLALIPIQPTLADFHSSEGIIQLIKKIGDFNEGLQARVVWNRVQKTLFMQNVREQEEALGIPALATTIGNRTAFPESMAVGGTVHDLEDAGKALEEVEGITDEIFSILGVSYGQKVLRAG